VEADGEEAVGTFGRAGTLDREAEARRADSQEAAAAAGSPDSPHSRDEADKAAGLPLLTAAAEEDGRDVDSSQAEAEGPAEAHCAGRQVRADCPFPRQPSPPPFPPRELAF
jgi:hypothetical protein